jgi:hypothetical protein
MVSASTFQTPALCVDVEKLQGVLSEYLAPDLA